MGLISSAGEGNVTVVSIWGNKGQVTPHMCSRRRVQVRSRLAHAHCLWRARTQYSTDTRVAVGTRSENGVRKQNVAVLQFFFVVVPFLFSALESVMELLGPLPRCDL